MKTLKMEIKLLEGFDDLEFGATSEDVVSYLGNPDEVEELEEGEEESKTLIWSYNETGFTLFFDGEDPKLFSCIETDNRDITLFGKKIFEMKSQEIIDLMLANGFEEMDEDEEEWGEKRVSFDEALVDFYFESDELVTVNWGVFFDEFEDSDLEEEK